MTHTASADRSAFCLNPYLALGLRHNPFVLETSQTIAAALWIDRGWSAPPQPRAAKLVQILGVKGAGKTSHLQHWRSQTGGPYCYYPPGWGRIKPPVVSAITYWDEADRIPWPLLSLALIAAARTSSTIVAGTHTDLGTVARLAGLSVITFRLKAFEATLLIDWARRRIEAARLMGQPCLLNVDWAKAEEIAAIARGSWRVAADELHIWAAQAANRATRVTPY